MSDTNETIADIIAEMRKPHDEICAKCHEEPNESCPYCGDPNGCNSPEYGQWPGVMTQLADRLDRARMRMEIEMANLRKENAKLREALVTVQNCDINKEEDCYTLYRVCEAALATTSSQNTQENNQ